MGEIIATAAVSLDGVVAHPERWSVDYWSDEEDRLNLDLLRNCSALLLGRETYQVFAEAWPGRTDEIGFADRINSISTFVVSTTLEKATWNNATIISEDPVGQIAALKQRSDGDVLIYGVGRLAHTLLAHDLLDELQLWLYPVLAASGRPEDLMFREGERRSMTLADTQVLRSGVVRLTYRSAHGAV